MEVYIDDILVKSLAAKDHIRHLQTCFEILNKYKMKLNPSKCTFAVTKRGIEANPKQIVAILDLPFSRNTQEV